jgi:hypothetical protein
MRPLAALPRTAAAVGLCWLAALTGCSLSPAPDLSAAPPPLPAYKPPAAPGQFCLDQLSERGIGFDMVPMVASLGFCSITNGVRVERLLAPFDKPATVTCPMALRLDDFEINVVQMAAQRLFNRRLVRIRQLSSYSCRNIAGTSRLSAHARGQAIDIAGFELEGGLVISVKSHWAGTDPRAQFLHEVAHGACRMFSVVLTPDSNADHHDHLHLDIGPRPYCDA